MMPRQIRLKVSSITGLATTAALTAVMNKIPDVSNLVKKTDYYAKILDNESKYFITSECNKFTNEIIDNEIKQKELVTKSYISGFIDNSDLNRKTATLASKAELKAEKDKKVKRQAFYSSYFRGNSYFEDDGTQNYLVFQSIYR